MSNTISIEKVQIKIGQKTIELTPKQALELRDILNETFPDKSVSLGPIVIERPVYVERNPWRFPMWNEPILYCATGDTACDTMKTLCLSTSGSGSLTG